MHIAITGASGLVGTALCTDLRDQGHTVTPVSRMRNNSEAWWDIDHQVMHLPQDRPIDGVIHLAGENIANRPWTPSQKARILNSRTEGTALLCKTLATLAHTPDCLICASAIGYYGDRGDRILNETSPSGQGFLAEVCRAWEAATRPASEAGIRVVHARLGVILSPKGGVLGKMRLPFRLGLGGPLGKGRQLMSWISIQDVVRSFEFLMDHANLEGPVNITAPNPVTNLAFTRALAKALHRPAFFRIPRCVITALLGDLGRELLLAGQNVLPDKLLNAGFEFTHPDIQHALNHLLNPEALPPNP